MSLGYSDRFDRTKYGSALIMAQKRAYSMTDQFNEPSYILGSPEEYIVVRGISWDYRTEWGSSDWPEWAKADPERVLVETIYPVDKLASNYRKAEGLKGRMETAVRKIRYDLTYEIDEMFRDYSDVRQMNRLVRSATEHLESIVINLGFEIDQAVRDHKETGHKKGAPSGV